MSQQPLTFASKLKRMVLNVHENFQFYNLSAIVWVLMCVYVFVCVLKVSQIQCMHLYSLVCVQMHYVFATEEQSFPVADPGLEICGSLLNSYC